MIIHLILHLIEKKNQQNFCLEKLQNKLSTSLKKFIEKKKFV